WRTAGDQRHAVSSVRAGRLLASSPSSLSTLQLIDPELAGANAVEEGSPLVLREGKHGTSARIFGVPTAEPPVCVRDLDAAGVTTAARLAPWGGREVGLLHRT